MMSKQKLLKLFIKFLKYHQVYDSYVLRLINTKGYKMSQNFIIRTIKKEPENLIMSAFLWVTPKNQKITWSQLHSEWNKILENNGFNVS